MDVATTIKKYGVEKAVDLMYKDPDKYLPKLMDWADNFAGNEFVRQRKVIRAVMTDPSHPYYSFLRRAIKEIDRKVFKKFAVNFFVNSALIGWPKEEEMRKKYDCNIPWAILMDPTSACNLHCTGCWASEYGNKLNLSYDEIDSIITQGKELGVYMYIYTGGEPLVRKKDLMRICEKHNDCIFMTFTNGTLIDEEFADDVLRVANFFPVISLEGFEEATDSRRGKGTYQKAVRAMEILREHKLIYGISCCYTSENYQSITSDEYLRSLMDMGVDFVWYFHYMPVGNDAAPELLPTPEQRRGVYERVRKFRNKNPLFCMDFQNDAEFVGGCIAGGHRYLHINANGDVDPCVFIHYSDSNIREKSLLDALRSPMMMQYHKNIPFNDNMLRPCPMLENPERIVEMVNTAHAHSTDPVSPEPVEHLVGKTEQYAANWKPTADTLWAENRARRAAKLAEEEKAQ